ncbi:polymorphic toxin-type HINT domain-containing protein, partial [Isoptericola sp. CG 20/1183]|uniref:polymorphic toxin-type HINT domain-containing protein n=2 Tax=Isoptericola TaxID=254250 RepID=UPI0010571F2E
EWVDAGDLRPGQWLQTGAGTHVQLTAIDTTREQARVHNLTIASTHTYHVNVGEDAILVHNTCSASGPTFIGFVDSPPAAIPSGASGPLATDGPGFQFLGGSGGLGLDSRVAGVRVMEATSHHTRRVVYMNRTGQTVNPQTGQTVAKSDSWAHLPW